MKKPPTTKGRGRDEAGASRQMNIKITDDLRRRLKLFAIEHDRPVQEVVNAALEDFLKRKGER